MKKLLFILIGSIAGYTASAQCNPTLVDSVYGYNAMFANTTNYTPAFLTEAVFTLNFGDGTSSPLPAGGVLTHMYASTGTYSASLVMRVIDTSTNTLLCEDSTFQIVSINGMNMISGALSIDSVPANPANPVFLTWLIRYDSVNQTLTAVDSVIDSGSNYFGNYEFDNVPYGNYFVKAEVLNGAASGTGPVPTYGTSSVYWSSATTIYHTGNTDYQAIHLQQGTVTSGAGFIGGSIAAGANKGTKVTGGAPGIMVILEDNTTGTIIQYVYTDANGDYSFSNLPVGNYKVYPEVAGYQTTAWTNITVTANQPTINNIGFTEHTMSKKVTPNVEAVATIAANSKVSLLPNPTTGQLLVTTPEAVQMQVTDVVGHVLVKTTLTSGSNHIDLSAFSSGIYLVTLQGTHVSLTTRVGVQH